MFSKIALSAIMFTAFYLSAGESTRAEAEPKQAGAGEKPADEVTNASEQKWNFHAQETSIIQTHPAFRAKYSGPHSLDRKFEIHETLTLDLFGGVRLWNGAELHADALMWQGFGLSKTFGIEDFPSGDAFKAGTEVPNGMLARLFVRQTIGFGGEQEEVPDDQLTLKGKQDISRLTLTLGRLSPEDICDNNAYAHDPHTQFMNWAFMSNVAWDAGSDSNGYSTGFAAEFNQPKWTLRYSMFELPRVPNGLTGDDKVLKWPGSGAYGPFLNAWAMTSEFERRYSLNDRPGTIRILGFLNEAHMANYSSARAILESNGPGSDISRAQANRNKYGFGLNCEQEIVKNIGVFARLGWNDGRNEAWTTTDVNYMAALGASAKGKLWHRPDDSVGLAGVASGASRANQRFLQAGGLGILAGDGALSYGWEKALETYYDVKIWKTIHLAADYQFIANPAFNRDRGPVSVFGMRLHWSF